MSRANDFRYFFKVSDAEHGRVLGSREYRAMHPDCKRIIYVSPLDFRDDRTNNASRLKLYDITYLH